MKNADLSLPAALAWQKLRKTPCGAMKDTAQKARSSFDLSKLLVLTRFRTPCGLLVPYSLMSLQRQTSHRRKIYYQHFIAVGNLPSYPGAFYNLK